MQGYSRINASGVIFNRVLPGSGNVLLEVGEHSLLYVESGNAEVDVEGRRTRITAGDCVFLRKDHRIILRCGPSQDGAPFRYIALFFCRRFLLEYFRSLSHEQLPRASSPRRSQSVLRIPQSQELDSLFLSLTPYLDHPESLSEDMAWAKRREGLLCVYRANKRFYASLFDFSHPWKMDILGFMEDNFSSDLTLSQMASSTGRSLSSFKRDFSKISPLTPARWVTTRRLEEAHKLLQAGSSVQDAMLDVGYKDFSTFSHAFKRHFGLPPSAVIREQ